MSGPLSDEVSWGWNLASCQDQRDWEKATKKKRPRQAPSPPASAARSSSKSRPPSSSRPSSSSAIGAPLPAPPLRADAPGRSMRMRGALPALASSEERAAAIGGFSRDIYAPSTRRAAQHKLSMVAPALSKWQYDLLPPDVEKITALGAALKAGHNRSAESYLTLYRGHLERSGYTITGPFPEGLSRRSQVLSARFGRRGSGEGSST
jgi:hypothetical protein